MSVVAGTSLIDGPNACSLTIRPPLRDLHERGPDVPLLHLLAHDVGDLLRLGVVAEVALVPTRRQRQARSQRTTTIRRNTIVSL